MKSLYNNYKKFTLQAIYINDMIMDIERQRQIGLRREIIEYSLIALQDAWNCFIRDVILLSATLPTENRSGRVFNSGLSNLKSMDSVLIHLRQNWVGRNGSSARKPIYWEPKWYDAFEGTTACNLLNLKNLDISAALSTPTNPIEELRAVRNYVAHKGRSTRSKIDELVSERSLSDKWHVVEDVALYKIQLLENSAGVEMLMEEWVRRFHVVAKQFI